MVPQSKDAFRAPARHDRPPFQADLAFRRPTPSGCYAAGRAGSPCLAGSTEFTLGYVPLSFVRFDILLPLLVTTVVAIAGWYVAHRMASARDRANKKRDLQTHYRIEAYRAIEAACARKEVMPYREGVERAIGDIQLFGSAEQVRLARRFTTEIETGSYTDPRALLGNLRHELRRELNLQPVGEQIWHFRVTGEVPPG